MGVIFVNVLADIYHGCTPASPYPPVNVLPAYAAVPGWLTHHMRCGRHGKNQKIFWTHLLLLDVSDVEDAYDRHEATGGAVNPALTDTVVIKGYPVPGQTTAFMVMLVQRAGLKYKVYLDRFQPLRGGSGGAVGPCPCCATLNGQGQVRATMGGTHVPAFDGWNFLLTMQTSGPDQGKWVGTDTSPCPGATPLNLKFYCLPGGTTVADLRLHVTGCTQAAFDVSPDVISTCAPLDVIFGVSTTNLDTCCGPVMLGVFSVNITLP